MKTLYLLRHAKSDRDNPKLSDIERPLNKRGRRDCQLLAAELQRQGLTFERVLCSAAQRTRETLKRISAECTVFDQAEMKITDDLYVFDPDELLTFLRDLPQDTDNLIIIGHNPAISELAELLCDARLGHIGTCTFIKLQVNVQYWDQLRGDCAKMVEMIRPKQFR